MYFDETVYVLKDHKVKLTWKFAHAEIPENLKRRNFVMQQQTCVEQFFS